MALLPTMMPHLPTLRLPQRLPRSFAVSTAPAFWLAGVAVLSSCIGNIEGGSGQPRVDARGDAPGGVQPAPVAGEPEGLKGITSAHNAVRAAVGVGAMRWNDSLASMAASFITDCEFMHSTAAERMNIAGFGYVGENLYFGGGQPTGAAVANLWASEQADYHYATNTCDRTCGHYTQMVWRASTDLGCAIKQCNGGYLVACEYGPGGNYGGQKPY